MKGWELLRDIAEEKVKPGSEFKDNLGNTYIYKMNEYYEEFELIREGNGIPDYSFFANHTIEFEAIESEIDIQNIEELNIPRGQQCYELASKQNEIIKALKQLDNQINQ